MSGGSQWVSQPGTNGKSRMDVIKCRTTLENHQCDLFCACASRNDTRYIPRLILIIHIAVTIGHSYIYYIGHANLIQYTDSLSSNGVGAH